jgi:hypothetical protein
MFHVRLPVAEGACERSAIVQIRSDVDESWRTLNDLTILVVGKGRYFGGGLCVMPGAAAGDGLLHSSSFQGLSLWHFIRFGKWPRLAQ